MVSLFAKKNQPHRVLRQFPGPERGNREGRVRLTRSISPSELSPPKKGRLAPSCPGPGQVQFSHSQVSLRGLPWTFPGLPDSQALPSLQTRVCACCLWGRRGGPQVLKNGVLSSFLLRATRPPMLAANRPGRAGRRSRPERGRCPLRQTAVRAPRSSAPAARRPARPPGAAGVRCDVLG